MMSPLDTDDGQAVSNSPLKQVFNFGSPKRTDERCTTTTTTTSSAIETREDEDMSSTIKDGGRDAATTSIFRMEKSNGGNQKLERMWSVELEEEEEQTQEENSDQHEELVAMTLTVEVMKRQMQALEHANQDLREELSMREGVCRTLQEELDLAHTQVEMLRNILISQKDQDQPPATKINLTANPTDNPAAINESSPSDNLVPSTTNANSGNPTSPALSTSSSSAEAPATTGADTTKNVAASWKLPFWGGGSPQQSSPTETTAVATHKPSDSHGRFAWNATATAIADFSSKQQDNDIMTKLESNLAPNKECD